MNVSMSKTDVAQQVQVGEVARYEEAERLVSRLADEQFPLEHLTIVGCDLQLHEQVYARLSWGRAALGGLATGAWIGLFVGLLFGLFATTTASGFAAARSTARSWARSSPRAPTRSPATAATTSPAANWSRPAT